MAEDISEIWPGPEDVALPESENEDAELIEKQGNPDVEKGHTADEPKGKGKEFPAKKHGLMALPSEIRETYVCSLPIGGSLPILRFLSILTMQNADNYFPQHPLSYRPRDFRIPRPRRPCLARGIRNAPSLRPPPLTMPILLSNPQCVHRSIYR